MGANQPVTLDQLREVIEASETYPTQVAAAASLDLTRGAFEARLRAARRAVDKGLFGTAPVMPGFRISQVSSTKDADGNLVRESIQQRPALRPESDVPSDMQLDRLSVLKSPTGELLRWEKYKQGTLSTETIVDALKEAFADKSMRWKPVPPPKRTDDDTVTIYPIVDWHVGLLAWAEETGENYDLSIAQDVILGAMSRLIGASPSSKQAIILGLGDLLHFDGYEAVTSAHGNFLDADGRYPKVLRTAARMILATVDMVLAKHETVLIRMLAGNHDNRSTVAINLALGMRFEGHQRVTVDDSSSYLWYHRFGQNLFGATHGDKAKMRDLPLIMAADRPQDWADSTNRRFYTGHLHSEKGFEDGGVVVTCMRTPVKKDAFHSWEGYRSGRSVYSETYRADGSEAATLTFNL